MTRVLVLNTGSSSLKWAVLGEREELLGTDSAPWLGTDDAARTDQIRSALSGAPRFDVVGHRVVHGGARFRETVWLDAEVRTALSELTHLAPEHLPASLLGIDAVTAGFPGVRQALAFDTSFHATLPEAARTYGLPFEWTERFGLYRFGFHGLSVAYSVERARELLGRDPGRLIVCHLGSGCSLTAVENGRSVDTSMGFSPLEGVVMATRPGSLDPGLVLFLAERSGLGIPELKETLAHGSGLLGVSGVSSDLREVLRAADLGSARAKLAYDLFVLSIRRALGAMTAVLGGVDTVVFTGGIGENSPRVRTDTARCLEFSGLLLDEAANRAPSGDTLVSTPTSKVALLVVQAREDLAIAREVRRLGE